MKARNQTFASYAQQIGITRQRMQQIADGVTLPSLVLALRLSEDLGIPVKHFAGAEDARVWKQSA